MREFQPWHGAHARIAGHQRFALVGLPGADFQLVSLRALEIGGDHIDAAMPVGTGDGNAQGAQALDIALEIGGGDEEGLMGGELGSSLRMIILPSAGSAHCISTLPTRMKICFARPILRSVSSKPA